MAQNISVDEVRLEQAVRAIDDRFEPAAILLYGTAATGKLRAGSDIDLAVLVGGSNPDPFETASLRTDLEALIGRAVDVVILDSASPILAMEVLRSHRLLLVRQADLLDRFVVKTLGAYFDLKRTRQPIEEALRRSAMNT
jgi:predicted nucleotidyltransferase